MFTPIRFPGNAKYTIIALIMILFAPCSGYAQTKGKLCHKCNSTGRIENPFMTESMKELEKDVLFCSYPLEKDKKGYGVDFIPCERCRNPDLAKKFKVKFDAIVKERLKWLEERKNNVSFLKPRRQLLFVETKHFSMTWNVPKIVTADRKTYRIHEAMHLYANRLEKFYRDFQSFFEIDDKEMRNTKHNLYLFETQKSCWKAAKEITGLTCFYAAKQPGNPSILITWKDNSTLKTDAQFHRHLIHHVSHLLNVVYYRMEWLATTAGWADAGLAHFFEIKYFNVADNTCDEEGTEEEFGASDWEFDVRKALTAGKLESFADLSVKSTTSLNGEDHKLAWSYIDFLLKVKPRNNFKVFMKAIKSKKACRDALKEAYGLSFIGMQTEWEAYVLDKYRTKPMKQFSRQR